MNSIEQDAAIKELKKVVDDLVAQVIELNGIIPLDRLVLAAPGSKLRARLDEIRERH